MKSNATTTYLNWALIGGAVVLLFCGIKYYNKSKTVRSYQVLIGEYNRLQTAQNLVVGLLNESVEYSKTHPAIEPTLEAIGAKPKAGAPAVPTPKPAK
ncbi:MAG TPA: hypothetical protein VFZ59_24240 [Verrucomicrobiae bacterium]|nr:hypothetical protein [Verrucomicrobiae bacterium]